MNRRAYATAAIFLTTASLIGAACATSGGAISNEDDDAATSQGGAGGADGSGGAQSACAIDCATIATDQCTQAVCDEGTGTCVVTNGDDGSSCDDGLFCTIEDVCQEGSCVGGPQNDCGLEVAACTEVVCNELSKSCTTSPAPNDTPCSAGDNPCMVNATCTNGLCIGQPKDCFFAPVPNECYTAVCNPQNGLCEPQIGTEGTACSDPNDPCTEGKTCSQGSCVGGSPKSCAHMTEGCFDGKCNPTTGQCFQDPLQVGESCASASDDCNAGHCSQSATCEATHINDGGACDDGFQCTTGTTCNDKGVCGGGTSTITIYFKENFATNNAGWTLGPEWEIGAAATQTGPTTIGNPDPSSDTTPTNDNGVARVNIGGGITPTLHDFYYLTSPVVDTSSATTLVLEFNRWLNTMYPPYMTDVIEVYDGSSWVVVWTTDTMQPSSSTMDNTWQHKVYDIAAYKNANMQVRFGFMTDQFAFWQVSSWNIDDLVIASAACNN